MFHIITHLIRQRMTLNTHLAAITKMDLSDRRNLMEHISDANNNGTRYWDMTSWKLDKIIISKNAFRISNQ